MSVEADPCPCELEAPETAPGAVNDQEDLARFVDNPDEIVWDGNSPRVSPGSFSKQDIRGGKGRSISTFRFSLTAREELLNRARSYNSHPSWDADPVISLAKTLDLRNIFDKTGRREVCVYAEPLDGTDDVHGPCASHAGIRRSQPASPKAQRAELNMLRDQIASAFGVVEHVISRTPLTREPE
jgi:hypothetical protein